MRVCKFTGANGATTPVYINPDKVLWVYADGRYTHIVFGANCSVMVLEPVDKVVGQIELMAGR